MRKEVRNSSYISYESVAIFRLILQSSIWKCVVDGFLIIKMPSGELLIFDGENKLKGIVKPHKDDDGVDE